MYAHSNELDETGIISLSGVKVEYNPDMEALFGVCTSVPGASGWPIDLLFPVTAETHFHSLHIIQLSRAIGSQCQGIAILDTKTGSNSRVAHSFTSSF